MRAIIRSVVPIVVCVILAAPASARQIIDYRGTTSAPSFHRVDISVVKQADGDRFITSIGMMFTMTCDDLTTQRWGIGVSGRIPVQADGTFSQKFHGGDVYWPVDGVLLWGKGSGTTKLNAATLTADGQDAQLCTTGDLTWDVDRLTKGGGTGAGRGTRIPDGVGFLKLRVRQGVVDVVKLVEP